MKLRLVVSLALLVLLAFAAPLAWTLLGWPPPRLVLKYGLTPGCEPTGETMTVEGIEFVEIGPGCFRMGSEHLAEAGDWLGRWCARFGLPWGNPPKQSKEMPVHWVEFENGFWIARTEVTNGQYERFDPGRTRHPRSESFLGPVVSVTWHEAKLFCAWLSEKSGLRIGLPSESEWECACRAGSESEYSFGQDAEQLEQYAWIGSNSERIAHDVTSRLPNPWGLFGLHGNAAEWCEDEWHEDYEHAPDDGGASIEGRLDSQGSPYRVNRGGSYLYSEPRGRSAHRNASPPATRFMTLGFRVAIAGSQE